MHGALLSRARTHAAEELRLLGHAFVGHDAPDEFFVALAETAAAIRARLEAGPTRDSSERMISGIGRSSMFGDPPAHGDLMAHSADGIVSGSENPMGMAIAVRCEHGNAVADVVLGAAFEGPPARAHGGVVAAIFDDLMVYQISIERVPAFTGRLTVTYRAAAPLGEPLVFRARFDGREGRKLQLSATAHTRDGDVLIAEATATFISIPVDHLLAGSDSGAPTS